MARRISRRGWVGGGLAIGAAAIVGRPIAHLACTALRDGSASELRRDGYADDASHLEGAPVGEVVRIEGDSETAIAGVRAALARARARGWPVSIAGARHTMGGHTIAPHGMVLDLEGVRSMALGDDGVLRAGAGARWHDVIRFLDPRGRAVSVMQSNSDFSIGGSLGANCHGWQPGRAPIATTVRSFTLVRADGRVVRASRTEEQETFAHAIGGYGLFGVMIDVALETVPNLLCRCEPQALSLDELAHAFRGEVAAGAQLAFGRLSIVPGSDRFEETLLSVYRADDQAVPPPVTDAPSDDLARLVFRGEEESDYGKELRWLLERQLGSEGGELVSRNQLMTEPARRFANRRADRTDVLFEGFVPPDAVAGYAREARRIVARSGVDLLNVTVRHVLEDRDTVLRYAREEVLGLVMLFTHARDRASDERMGRATRALVDASLDHGGTYYLPYRAHATREQLARAYPQARELAAAKLRHDPDRMFQNRLWQRYLEG